MRQQRQTRRGFAGRTDMMRVGNDRQASDFTDGVLRRADHGGSALFLSTETMVGAGSRLVDDTHRRLQLSRLLRRENVDALEADVLEQVYDEYIDVELRVVSSSRDTDSEFESEFDTVL